MITEFNITTTGIVSPVKLEGLGSYHEHPTTNLNLLDRFTIEEIVDDEYLQLAIDNGEITVTDENGDSIVNLTYLKNGAPIFDTDNFSESITYVGFGEPLACNILRITTTGKITYTSLWANGEKNFTKNWSDRYTYTYL